MWKWIVGALLLLVVALGATCYVGYKKMTSGGDSAVVAIGAPAAKVWATLADADSMAVWMESKVMTSRHGLLMTGDTLHVESSSRGAARQQLTWFVSDVQPGALLVMQMRNDSTGQVFASRRDSLVSNGDSTTIISTIASPMMDSIRDNNTASNSKIGGAVLDFSSKMLVSAFRALSEQDLKRLKLRLEGKPLPK